MFSMEIQIHTDSALLLDKNITEWDFNTGGPSYIKDPIIATKPTLHPTHRPSSFQIEKRCNANWLPVTGRSMLNPLISMHYGGSNHVEYRFVCGLLKCIKPVACTNRCPYVSFCLSSRHANQLGQSKRQTVDEGLDDLRVFQCGLNHTFIIGLSNQSSLLHALGPSKHWIKTFFACTRFWCRGKHSHCIPLIFSVTNGQIPYFSPHVQ